MELLVQWVRNNWVIVSLFLFITIVALSFTPLKHLARNDKILHFAAYSVLALPLVLKKPNYWILVLIGYGLCSGGIELIQLYANHRTDVMDVLANIVGLVSGSIVAFAINWLLPERVSN